MDPKRTLPRTVQCQLCGRKFNRITQSHLDSAHPGVDLETYRKTYGPTTQAEMEEKLALTDGERIANVVIEQIKDDPALMKDIASRVGSSLFSTELRGKFVGTVLMLLNNRLQSFGKMQRQLEQVNEELFTPERIEAGGPFGAPTDTATLIQIGRLARDNMADAEDALLRMVKLAVDDSKTPEQQQPINIFTGKHETLIIPPEFSPKQRETLRRLGSRVLRPGRTVAGVIEQAKNAEYEGQA